jgi:hypothetical protein
MERVMNFRKQEAFVSANQELSKFLRKVDCLANGTGSVTEADLLSLSRRIEALSQEVHNYPLAETVGDGVPNEVSEYVKNLRAVQAALETVRCVMLARKTQLDGAKRHLRGVQGWVNAYRQTT